MKDKEKALLVLIFASLLVIASFTYIIGDDFFGHTEADYYINPNYTSDVRIEHPADGTTGITEDKFYFRFFAKTDASPNEVDLVVWVDGDYLIKIGLPGTYEEGRWYNVSMSDTNYYTNSNYEWQVTIWHGDETSELIYSTKKYEFDTYSRNPPVADAGGPYQVEKSHSITLDGSGSYDPDGNIVEYAWDTDGDGDFEWWGETPSVGGFDTPGTFDIYLKVTDNDGYTDSDTTTITVVTGNNPPVADAGGPYEGHIYDGVHCEVELDGSGSSDSDGTISLYEWDVDGDGTYDTEGVSPSVTYAEVGTYTAVLRVTDDDGSTDTDTATVEVTSNPPSPDEEGWTDAEVYGGFGILGIVGLCLAAVVITRREKERLL